MVERALTTAQKSVFTDLGAPVVVDWLSKEQPWAPEPSGVLEVHAVPVVPTSWSARRLSALAESLPAPGASLPHSPLPGCWGVEAG